MSLFFEELPRLIPCRLVPQDLQGLVGEPAIDTRKIEPRQVFWALQGEKSDGHDFVGDAFARGAQAAVVSQAWFDQQGANAPQGALVVVEDTLTALQSLAAVHRRRFHIPLIALTGSNGKTATQELLAAALSTKYRIVKSFSSFNNHIGLPLTLLKINTNTEVAIAELGTNHPGEIEFLCSIAQPDLGIVLNVGPAHLEGLGSVEAVAREKSALFSSLPPSGTAFVNLDDPFVRCMTSTAQTRICYGFNGDYPEASCQQIIRAKRLPLSSDGRGRFQLLDWTFGLSLYGEHQLQNALAAAVVAHHLEVPLTEIVSAFKSVQPANGRLNVMRVAGITLLDDSYNANPASTSAALHLLRSLQGVRRKYVILGDHLELGRAAVLEHRRLGELIAESALNGVFLIGSLVSCIRDEIPDQILFYESDLTEISAILNAILQTVKPGDAVLVKASRGMKLERIVQGIRSHLEMERS
ncbi:MAG: UDP-N-acetylmuramoyl-tripeptide--D-alanyl-D-alanine ligase [bacterium]